MASGTQMSGGDGCADQGELQRLIDGELSDAAAELLAHHLQTCDRCRSDLAELRALVSYVQGHLGAEDDREEQDSARILRQVGRSFGPPDRAPARRAWWRWLAAAAAVALAATLGLPIGDTVEASAERLLAANRAREQAWLYQPNKVLHWQVRTVVKGIRGMADATTRTAFWRRNGSDTFDEISRRYDDQGETLWAHWRQPDGSAISYRAADGERLEIAPATTALEAALPSLEPALRRALQDLIARRQRLRTLDFQSRHFADWLEAPSSGGPGLSASTRREWIAGAGEVFRVTVVDAQPHAPGTIVRVVHEHDIEPRTFRRLRLRTTFTYADGSVGVHDSTWTAHQEGSAADFESNVPHDLLQRGLPTVRLTPIDVARRHYKDLGLAGKGTE